MIKVSIIVPVYNTGKYLAECLESIINQSLEEIEIICVNDGSTDDSLNILHEFEEKNNNVKVLNGINSGPGVSRNKGLDIASGKYVYFMDSDDLIASHMMEDLWNICEEKELDVIYFSGKSFFENEELETKHKGFANNYLRKCFYENVLSGPELFAKFHENKDYFQSPCLQFVRRELLTNNNIRFPEYIVHEDNNFTFETILSAKRAYCLNDIYFYRRVRSDSIMTKPKTHANVRGYFVSLLSQLEFVRDLNIDDEEIQEKITLNIKILKDNINKIYIKLSQEEKDEFYKLCNPYERYFFDAVILSSINEVKSKNKEIKKLKKQLNDLKESHSYKIGRCATYPIRMVKKALK